MSLRGKIVAILAVCVTLYTTLVSLILFIVILPSFSKLELAEGRQDLNRLTEQVNREAESLLILCADWAYWDEMYRYVVEPDPAVAAAYEDLNLNLVWFRKTGIDLLYVVNLDGKVVWHRTYRDLSSENPEQVEVAELPGESWALSNPLLCRGPEWEGRSGVLSTSAGLMMAACLPIRDNAIQAEPRGTLVMGRLLDDELTRQICSLAQVEGTLIPIAKEISQDEREALANKDAPVVKESPRVLHLYRSLPGLLGSAAIVARVDVSREIVSRGSTAVLFALISTVAGGLLAFAAVFVLLRWSVVKPLWQLTRHVTGTAVEGNLTPLEMPPRRDELGVLAREFNRMIERIRDDTARRHAAEEALRDSQAQVLRAEHLAELGEMGATIAHEIRNPITGISGTVQVLRKSYELDDERRALMDDLLEHVRRVDGIVQRVLTFSRRSKPAKQPVDLYALTAKACREACARRGCGSGVLNVEPRERLVAPADPLLIEQVLWNLLENAFDAVQETADPAVITCRFEETEDAVRIMLADNGPGISPDAAGKLFRTFFTTKANGTGLGLVVCKRIVEAHGGKLSLNGRSGTSGTEAVIELPKGT